MNPLQFGIQSPFATQGPVAAFGKGAGTAYSQPLFGGKDTVSFSGKSNTGSEPESSGFSPKALIKPGIKLGISAALFSVASALIPTIIGAPIGLLLMIPGMIYGYKGIKGILNAVRGNG